MKPKYVHTKVQYQQQRSTGDDPNMGRVSRMPGGSQRLTVRKRLHDRSGKSSSRRLDRRRIRQMRARKFAITLWLSILLCGCFLALVVGMFIWLRSQGDRRNIAPLIARADSLPALHLTDFPPPGEQEALEILQNAIAARDEATLRAYVHDNPEVDATEMVEFFAATDERDGTFANHQWIGSSDTDRQQVQALILAFNKDEQLTQRLAMLLPNESGVWRLDFLSYTRWCDPPIRLMDGPTGYPGGRVRMFIARDHYFNGPFSDEREWICYVLTSPDSHTRSFAYCPVGSPEHLKLDGILARNSRPSRVTLDIIRVENARLHQFRIAKVVSDDWIALDTPTEH